MTHQPWILQNQWPTNLRYLPRGPRCPTTRDGNRVTRARNQPTHIPVGTDRQARKGRLGSLLPQQAAMVRDRQMYLRYPFNCLTSCNHQADRHQADRHHSDRTGGRHPRYPAPPGPPDPPAPWVLDAANLGPWASLKPEMVKVPDDFHGDSNDIARFFSQCDMYFSIFNQHFYYHPHKVIFCASRFRKEAQVWWELCARGLGRDAQGFQLYPAYEQFVKEVR